MGFSTTKPPKSKTFCRGVNSNQATVCFRHLGGVCERLRGRHFGDPGHGGGGPLGRPGRCAVSAPLGAGPGRVAAKAPGAVRGGSGVQDLHQEGAERCFLVVQQSLGLLDF